MQEESRLAKALADGAELLVKQLAQCHEGARACTEVAWTPQDVLRDGRSIGLEQAFQFMRLAGELGAALAKLKDQVTRQHIAVERLNGAGPLPARPLHVAAAQIDQGEGGGAESDKQLDGVASGA